VVWAASHLLGCSRVQCETITDVHDTAFDGSFMTVCYYGPTYATHDTIRYEMLVKRALESRHESA